MKKSIICIALMIFSLAGLAQGTLNVIKISDLPSATPLTGTELMPYVQGTQTRKGQVNLIRNFLLADINLRQRKLLTGYTVGTNTALSAGDSVIAAFGKIQGQLNYRLPYVDTTGQTGNYLRKVAGGYAWSPVTGGGGSAGTAGYGLAGSFRVDTTAISTRSYMSTFVNGAIAGKANNSAVVHLTGTENISGPKSFSSPLGFTTSSGNIFSNNTGGIFNFQGTASLFASLSYQLQLISTDVNNFSVGNDQLGFGAYNGAFFFSTSGANNSFSITAGSGNPNLAIPSTGGHAAVTEGGVFTGRVLFTPTTSNSAINLAAGNPTVDPSGIYVGDVWYNVTLGKYRVTERVNSTNVAASVQTEENAYDFKSSSPITSNYTVQQSDNGKLLRCANLSSITITVPPGLTSRFSCNIARDTTGAVSIVGGSGVYIKYSGSTTSIQNVGSAASIGAVSSNSYRAYGDFSSASAGGVTSFAFTNGSGFTGTVSNSTTTPTLSLALQNATASQAGQVSAADWNTFNNKANTNYQTATEALAYQVRADHMDLIANWQNTLVGTGAGVQADMYSTTISDVISLNTGTTSTGKAAIQLNANFGPQNIVLGSKIQIYSFTFIVGTLSDGTNNSKVRVGLADGVGDSPNRGLFVEYNPALGTDFQIGYGTGGTINYTTTGITVVAGRQYTFSFLDQNSGAAQVRIYGTGTSNPTYLTITTGIPNGLSNRLTPIFYILKTLGTSQHFLYADMYHRYYAQ